MGIAEGLSAIGHALGVSEQLMDAQLDKPELKARLAGICGDLADAKIALADAQTAIRERDALIAKLQAAAQRKPTVHLYRGFPFRVEDGKVTAGPHCPNCHERGSLVLLGRGHTAVLEICPRCKGEFRHAPGTSHAQKHLDSQTAAQ